VWEKGDDACVAFHIAGEYIIAYTYIVISLELDPGFLIVQIPTPRKIAAALMGL